MLIYVATAIFIYQVINVLFKLSKRERTNDAPHDYFKWDVIGRKKKRLPIVTNEKFDMGFILVEKLLPFDLHKWIKMHRLVQDQFKDDFSLTTPLKEADEQVLLTHHPSDYVKSLHSSSSMIASVVGEPVINWIPSPVLRSMLVTPFKWQSSGTILASRQAMIHGAAINIGGGWHHCHKKWATLNAFCLIDDIGLAITYLWNNVNRNLRFFIIDLDAHQGNGYQRTKGFLPPGDKEKILIMDIYNKDIFADEEAKLQINYKIEIKSGTGTDEYIDILKKAIATNSEAIKKFKPDLVIYNAGSDIMKGDRLGELNVNADGIVTRDELVFQFCRDNHFPIVLVTSGGGIFTGPSEKTVPEVFAISMKNLTDKGLIKPVVEEQN